MTLGEKLQKLRKARSWTQEELAEKADVSRQSLSKWESDGALPDTVHIVVLADLFGITTDYLLRSGEDAPAPHSSGPEEGKHPGEPPTIHVEAPVVQVTPSSRKSPPGILVFGLTLLVAGLLVWLRITYMESMHPHEYHVNGMVYSGIQGYIRGNDLEIPYYVSLYAMLLGALTAVIYLLLHHFASWQRRRH